MSPDEPVVIERTTNGYLVRAAAGTSDDMRERFVFQRLQYDETGVQHSDKCLVGFLLKHFSEP